MKNIFSKSNAPYLGVTIAVVGLLASGVFALAPYVAILAPVAALGVGLPFIISGAVLSVVAGVLSAVAISKNNTISQQEKFENLVAARKKEEAKERAELKAKGLLPDAIELPGTPRQENFSNRQEKFENRVAQRKAEEAKERAELKLPDVIELPYKLISVPDIIELPYKETEAPIQPNQPTKEEDGQGWISWGRDKVKSLGSKVNTVAREYAPHVVPTALTAATIFLASSFGIEKGESEFGYTNGTQCFPYR
ncbi:hypothetical protein [Wolbachia endosymbiont of Ctenocephalides felis wCfeJ]|uniref:hypothetical protein n=1 Tax=Wolbachia endosymbiont of Ctenocephalides felis wCfeJ TaxID=2732594 RepID=UPI001447E6B2|nr:hypothetical protein [Wolbachia endosymbiont of Ctenocephalides felis wCfeJ]WCR58120.1 MAG: hypothetical protein PG980_000592 [Wolbachia endosymbiont of Ctenocephalides felis wCfeJ]